MSTNAEDREEVRDLIRKAIHEVLNDLEATTSAKFDHYQQVVPAQKELTLDVRGSERSIRLLKEALMTGEVTLEIAIGNAVGPKVRVQAHR